MKKFKVDMQKIFSVPFVCYVYAIVGVMPMNYIKESVENRI